MRADDPAEAAAYANTKMLISLTHNRASKTDSVSTGRLTRRSMDRPGRWSPSMYSQCGALNRSVRESARPKDSSTNRTIETRSHLKGDKWFGGWGH